jgi:hypothetical protein
MALSWLELDLVIKDVESRGRCSLCLTTLYLTPFSLKADWILQLSSLSSRLDEFTVRPVQDGLSTSGQIKEVKLATVFGMPEPRSGFENFDFAQARVSPHAWKEEE